MEVGRTSSNCNKEKSSLLEMTTGNILIPDGYQ
jgi:hypothetical protein